MKCISCGSSNFKPMSIYNPQNTNEQYTYLFCESCGLGIIDLDLNKDYSSNYDKDYFEYQENSTSVTTKIIEFFSLTREEYVLKYRIRIESILDIGCGVGSFLNNLKNHFKKFYGTELNESAKKIVKEKNNKIIILEKEIPVSDKFDVITLWHVLEHINHPKEFLNKIINNMNLESTLFIEVPNNNSWNFRFFSKNYSWISLPEHLYYYNENSLRFICKSLNLEIINIYYPRQFPLLFSSHFSNFFLKAITTPLSLVIFLIAPLFKASESIRLCIRLKKTTK